MAFSPRTIRIIGASTLSVVLIAGAYVFSGPVPFLKNKFADAESTDALLKAYAAKDTDGDGLPDWEEALYGTDPNNAHSFSAALTDSQAANKGLLTPKTSAPIPGAQATSTPVTGADVPGPTAAPGSITEQFSHDFLEKYTAATSGGTQLTDAQQQALMNQLLASYTTRASDLLVSKYTAVSVRTSSSVTVTDYAGVVEQIIRSHDVPADSSQPFPLLQAFVEQNDESARGKLRVLGASYAGIAKDLLQVQVPPSLAAQHLALLRSFDTLSRSTNAVVHYEDDPLAVLGSLSLYPKASQDVVDAFSSIAQVLIANGEPASGTPGAMIVNVARSFQQQS